jgi:hypothetical protein
MNNLFYNILFIYSIYLHQLPSFGKKKKPFYCVVKKKIIEIGILHTVGEKK